ncbi:PTS sugar transporter subunit IIB [Glaciihabitans sp. dw_435]|uniref:PTS sugar transporter subunit IIB n=1 Tax=Glaciihabitans sp. dw_435 TaxID=2720081 RepID=UPI001BD2612C|nr:PTS sugar transporter subunit IIC [Glaciihabitans sp. dw_435]
MTTILIICGAGASSTFLASRMRALATSRGIPLTIQAASDDELDARLPSTDVLLVGAHLAGDFDSIVERAASSGVPAYLLPDTVFGPGGAEAAFALATGPAPIGHSASNN